MKSDAINNTFSDVAVAQLQDQLFPVKGTGLSQPSAVCKEDKSEEGYTCHRLQTPTKSKDSSSLSLLYNVVKEACAQQNVKWPVECQVIPDVIQHLEDWPLYPEVFYQPSGRELRPQPVGDETGRIVYQYYPTSTVNYFTRSCVGGNKQLSQDVRPTRTENDTALHFESRFESGNLAKCVQISECYYEIHIRADLYTARHMQWFYFAVSNTRKSTTYRFSIVNLSKGDSLYNHGLKPLMYSLKESTLHNVGWRRCGSNIVYFRNQDCDGGCYDSDDEGEEMSPSYTLTFNIIFPHDFDTVFLAHCFPYTFSMLQQHLLCIQNDSYRSMVCRQRVLCRSLAGNPVYILTITSQEPEDEHKKKRAVVLTARVHPGETPSSWIMKGTLDFLTSDNSKAVELRRQFVFKVIPMVNPDGVIVGNHRCSLAGRDLNRQYKMVIKEMFPAVWHTKAMVRRLMDELGVMLFCDFHAHSRKHNIFLYGCENRRNNENHLREQIFPLLLHYNADDKFSFRNCKFRVQRCKEGTARVVAWMMGILHSYTLESSFGGSSEGPRSGTHYSILDFLTMGRQFCESLSEYFDTQPGKCSIDSNEETTSYVERVGELISTRLAVSDNEGDSSVSYWELRSPTRQWDQINSHGSGLPKQESQRSLSQHSGQLETLGPFVAKTRLHEPRVSSRSPRSPILHQSSKAGGGNRRIASNSFRNHSDGEKGTPILKKKRNAKKTTSETSSDVLIKGKLTKVYIQDSEHEENFKEENYDSSKVSIPPQIIPPTRDGAKLLCLQPEVEYVDDKGLTPSSSRKQESAPRILTDSKPLKIEDDPLCADIVACDTLFLDIGSKETPQLKAARNLKGRLKKKKKDRPETTVTDGEKCQFPDENNDISKSSSQDQNVAKPKNKIKIVIGKRPKPKSKKSASHIID